MNIKTSMINNHYKPKEVVKLKMVIEMNLKDPNYKIMINITTIVNLDRTKNKIFWINTRKAVTTAIKAKVSMTNI